MTLFKRTLKLLLSISWFDFFGILLFAAIISFSAFFFLRKGSYTTVVIKLNESESIVDPDWRLRTPIWYADKLKPGIAKTDWRGATEIKIKDVYSFAHSEVHRITYVTLELKTIYDSKSHNHLYNGVPLLIGVYQVFQINDLEIRGIVYQFGDLELNQPKWIEVTGYLNHENIDTSVVKSESTSDGIRNYLAAQFKEGSVSRDSKGNAIAEVIEVKKRTAYRSFIQSGRVMTAVDPERTRVETKIRLLVEDVGGLTMHKKDYHIMIGTDVWLDFKDFGVNLTITGLEKKMSRVLITFYDLGLGGIQTKIIDLANKLASNNNEVIVIVESKKSEFDRAQLLDKTIKFISIENLPILLQRYHFWLLVAILYYRPNSVFVSLEKTSVIVLMFTNWLKIFYDYKIIVNIDIYLKDSQEFKSRILTKYFNKASSVIAVSKDTYNDLKKRLQIHIPPLKQIYNWIQIDDNKPDFKTYSQRSNTLIFAGRFEKQKRPLFCLAFMKLMSFKGFHNFSLKMYGEGSLARRMNWFRLLWGLKNSVRFYKPIHTIDDQLKKSKYLLLTSYYEGLPFIVLEALKNGCVVLCLDAPGLREIIVDEQTGFRKKTLSELVEVVEMIEQNPLLYTKIQRQAFNHVLRDFSNSEREKLIELLSK